MSQKPTTFPAQAYIKIVESIDEEAGRLLREVGVEDVQACIDDNLRIFLPRHGPLYGLTHVWTELFFSACDPDADVANVDPKIDKYLNTWIIPKDS